LIFDELREYNVEKDSDVEKIQWILRKLEKMHININF